jgi:hypothetical protein
MRPCGLCSLLSRIGQTSPERHSWIMRSAATHSYDHFRALPRHRDVTCPSHRRVFQRVQMPDGSRPSIANSFELTTDFATSPQASVRGTARFPKRSAQCTLERPPGGIERKVPSKWPFAGAQNGASTGHCSLPRNRVPILGRAAGTTRFAGTVWELSAADSALRRFAAGYVTQQKI